MLLKILYVLIAASVMTLTPFYVKAQKDGACPKSLLLKMIAATGYLVNGVIGMQIADNFGKFAKLLLGALIASWVGDFFLHLWQHKAYKALGFTGFLTAHVFFICAFVFAVGEYAPERSFLSIAEIVAIAVFDAFFLVFSAKIGTKLKGILKIPILLYATVITTMLLKATALGIAFWQTGTPLGLPAVIVAVTGGVCFVASDFTIAILMFNEKHKKNYKLKMFNMITYFASELLLSSLMLLIK